MTAASDSPNKENIPSEIVPLTVFELKGVKFAGSLEMPTEAELDSFLLLLLQLVRSVTERERSQPKTHDNVVLKASE